MSRNALPQTAVRQALASQIDGPVDASLAQVELAVQLAFDQMESRFQARLTKLTQRVIEAETRIAELEGKLSGTADDKYRLTKANLIAIAKDLGYL